MTIDIYKEVILDHYKNPRNYGTLEGSHKNARVSNPLCGDDISIEVVIRSAVIDKVQFTGTGCAIATASASMLTDYAKGKPVEKVLELDGMFMLQLLSIELSPNRLKCALVSLEALQKAVKK